jgi:hypothetical protein
MFLHHVRREVCVLVAPSMIRQQGLGQRAVNNMLFDHDFAGWDPSSGAPLNVARDDVRTTELGGCRTALQPQLLNSTNSNSTSTAQYCALVQTSK